jgi:ABC-2 type transport system permease protein
MATINRNQSTACRPSTLGLLRRQVGYQLKLLARSPMSAFATLVVPLMVLLAVNLLYAGTHLSSRGGIDYAQFFTPAMVAFAVVNACYMSLIPSTVLARDQGILKRIRSTPLPPWVYMAGRIISSGVVATAGAVAVIAVGAGVYGFQLVWESVPAVLVTLAVGMFCFCSLGLAVTVLVPSADSALPIAWGTMLPLCFISDVFQPVDNAPPWLRMIASAFPLRPFADDLESAFNPVTGSGALHPAHLGLMAVWGSAAAAFALLAFRWEPGSRHRHRKGSRRSATFATDHVRELLEDRGRRAARTQPKRKPVIQPMPPPRAIDRNGSEFPPPERIEGPAPTEDSSVPSEEIRNPPGQAERAYSHTGEPWAVLRPRDPQGSSGEE